MRKKRSEYLPTQSQTANFYNNIASAWFIGSIINPFFIPGELSFGVFVRATIGIIIAYIFLYISIYQAKKT